jgi:hypothetical protein
MGEVLFAFIPVPNEPGSRKKTADDKGENFIKICT